jgi:hypothetical protein
VSGFPSLPQYVRGVPRGDIGLAMPGGRASLINPTIAAPVTSASQFAGAQDAALLGGVIDSIAGGVGSLGRFAARENAALDQQYAQEIEAQLRLRQQEIEQTEDERRAIEEADKNAAALRANEIIPSLGDDVQSGRLAPRQDETITAFIDRLADDYSPGQSEAFRTSIRKSLTPTVARAMANRMEQARTVAGETLTQGLGARFATAPIEELSAELVRARAELPVTEQQTVTALLNAQRVAAQRNDAQRVQALDALLGDQEIVGRTTNLNILAEAGERARREREHGFLETLSGYERSGASYGQRRRAISDAVANGTIDQRTALTLDERLDREAERAAREQVAIADQIAEQSARSVQAGRDAAQMLMADTGLPPRLDAVEQTLPSGKTVRIGAEERREAARQALRRSMTREVDGRQVLDHERYADKLAKSGLDDPDYARLFSTAGQLTAGPDGQPTAPQVQSVELFARLYQRNPGWAERQAGTGAEVLTTAVMLHELNPEQGWSNALSSARTGVRLRDTVPKAELDRVMSNLSLGGRFGGPEVAAKARATAQALMASGATYSAATRAVAASIDAKYARIDDVYVPKADLPPGAVDMADTWSTRLRERWAKDYGAIDNPKSPLTADDYRLIHVGDGSFRVHRRADNFPSRVPSLITREAIVNIMQGVEDSRIVQAQSQAIAQQNARATAPARPRTATFLPPRRGNKVD